MKNSLNEVWRISETIVATIENWLKSLRSCPACNKRTRLEVCVCGNPTIACFEDGKKPFLRYKPIDKVRLLKFKTWEYRYKVEISTMLDLIMPVLQVHIKSKSKTGLGVSIATLCSHGAEKILRDQLRKKYGRDEQIAIWRANERDKQLIVERRYELDGLIPRDHRPLNMLEFESVRDYVSAYSVQVDNRRRENQKIIAQSWRRRKRYRGSPWL